MRNPIRLFPLLGLLFSAAAVADGFVVLDYADYEDHSFSLRANGARIHLQASETWTSNAYPAGLVALDANGNVVTSFGQSGWVGSAANLYVAADELLSADGSAHLLRAQNVERRDSAGALLTTSATLYTGLATATTGSKFAEVFARQPDGKFVIGGEYAMSAMGGDSYRWTLTRLNADLSAVDTTLGGGVVVIDLPHTGPNQGAMVKSIHVLGDGKILMSGRSVNSTFPTTTWQTVIARLNSNGSLDAGFGTNALVVLPDSSGITQVDSTGRIYLAEADGTVSRFSSSGTPDAGYAGGTGDAALHVTGFELDSQERAVVFGWTTVAAVRLGYVARLDTSGAPDAAFNTTGSTTITFPMTLIGTPVQNLDTPVCVGTIQATDKPLLACDVVPTGDVNDAPLADLAIARLTAAGMLDTTFGATQVDSDVFPDDYYFAPASVPYGTAHVQSGTVTLSGVNAPVRLSVGGEVSVGCNGTWLQSPIMVQAGDTFCVRGDAAAVANASTQVTVNVGGRITNFVIQATSSAADTIPNAFSFASQTNVAPGVLVTSAPMTVQGITGYATATVTNGYFSLNCDGSNWSGSYSHIENGMTICVSHYASTTSAGSVTTTLNVGGTLGTFTSTTEVIDSTPDAFSFTDQTNVALDSPVVSNTLTITGITHAPISITDGEYSIGCNGTFTAAAGTIANNQTVCVRTWSGITLEMTTSATLNIGGVTDQFSVSTPAIDRTPDAFTFTARTGVALNTPQLSNTITVAGINDVTAISIVGGEYSVGCNAFTTAAGQVHNGDTVCVRHTSSASSSTTVTSALTIGGVSANFSSTTVAASSGGGSSGSSGGGGSLDALWLGFALGVLGLVTRQRRERLADRPG